MNLSSTPIQFSELATGGRLLIGVAQLNAEKSLNALTLEMIDLLSMQMQIWANDPRIALVMLEGAGERAFCAGADLHRMHAASIAHRASTARDDIRANSYALNFFTREYRLDYIIHTYPKPVLCWGQGVIMGGGVGLMIGASHRVVTEQAKLAMPEINIGLYADVGGSWFLSRAPGETGIFLALTAAQLTASDALFAGFADYSITHAKKAAVIHTLTRQAWSNDATRNACELSGLLQSYAEPSLPHGPLRQHFDLIQTLCRHDDPNQLVAAMTSLSSDDPWLSRAAATLTAGSPTTAALSIALQRRLKLCSLAEVFRAELVASLTCAVRPDLTEGIRALLIDKDRTPRWQPATIAAVTPAWIDGFFVSPWAGAAHPLADLGVTV